MNARKVRKWVYGMCLWATIFGGGCTDTDEQVANQNRGDTGRQEQVVNKTPQEAEAKRVEEERKAAERQIEETPLTVVNKYYGRGDSFFSYPLGGLMGPCPDSMSGGVLCFDADGNPDTIEWILVKNAPWQCEVTDMQFGAVNVGDTRTKAEWTKYFSHPGEDKCVRLNGSSSAEIKGQHRISWERIPEADASADATPYKLLKKSAWGSYKYKLSSMWETTINRYALYFDTNGDNVVDVVAIRDLPCTRSEALYALAKVGDSRTKAEWVDLLTHDHEDNCYNMKFNRKEKNKKLHRWVWQALTDKQQG